MERRLSPEELRAVVGLSPRETIDVGEHFYLQVFENTPNA